MFSLSKYQDYHDERQANNIMIVPNIFQVVHYPYSRLEHFYLNLPEPQEDCDEAQESQAPWEAFILQVVFFLIRSLLAVILLISRLLAFNFIISRLLVVIRRISC